MSTLTRFGEAFENTNKKLHLDPLIWIFSHATQLVLTVRPHTPMVTKKKNADRIWAI